MRRETKSLPLIAVIGAVALAAPAFADVRVGEGAIE